MHDKIYANQQAIDRPALEKYAQELGLDMGKFKAALDSGKFRAAIEADSAKGNEVGANGTPTFFINGREFVGAQPFESFKGMIDEEIKHADKILATGVKMDKLYDKLIEDGIAHAPAAPAAAPGAPAAPPAVANIEVGDSPVKGAKNAPVTIVEFSDFQCPFCSRVEPTLSQIEKEYAGKVKIAWKNQPLPFHQNARPAAMAAMAANEQGKFWEMHDKMFANQQNLDRASLEKYGQEIGLDMGKFKAALDSNKFDAKITADSNEGNKVGANGTPTFYINGRQLVGAQPVEAFKAMIDEELKKKK
jgi:protein-disulfide isomerase